MTNEELDRARVDEAMRLWDGSQGSLAVITARLAREGWTPPKAVDPDLAEAKKMADDYEDINDCPISTPWLLKAIWRGRELERAEAKPGLDWKRHDRSAKCPVGMKHLVLIAGYNSTILKHPASVTWDQVSLYAIITPPTEDVA